MIIVISSGLNGLSCHIVAVPVKNFNTQMDVKSLTNKTMLLRQFLRQTGVLGYIFYCCPDCPSCPVSAIQMGQAAWAIWAAIKKKYSLK